MGKTVKHAKTGQAQKKKLPAAPLGGAAQKVKKTYTFEKRPRNFRIGGDIQPVRDLTRFMKWPKFIRLQRQKRILMQRVKVPPAIAQFDHALDKTQFIQLARLCKNISPETRAQKKERLQQQAKAAASGERVEAKCPPTIKFGINHVTDLVEQKKAKLVIIAHDVDPVELVMWLPALCRKMDVPYCVVKSKSRLGQLVHKKTAAALAITAVRPEDKKDLDSLVETCKTMFNENKEVHRHWGGGVMGNKSKHVIRKREILLEKEEAKKHGM